MKSQRECMDKAPERTWRPITRRAYPVAPFVVTAMLLAACASETASTGDGSSDSGSPVAPVGSDGSVDSGAPLDGASSSDSSSTSDGARPTAEASVPNGDEFDGPALTLTDLFPALHDVATVQNGKLTLAPVVAQHTHWYSDSRGPMVYRSVTGDFMVETDVTVGRRADIALPPRGTFSAAGFVVRDPASSAPGGEAWVMYNIGMQTGAAAREAKSTRKGTSDSLSTLYLMETGGGLTAKLRVCRLGSTFHFFHRMPGESSFVEEAFGATTSPQGNGASQSTPGVVPGGVIRFVRSDLPPTVQVGLVAGHWEQTLETRAEFDYLRFRSVSSLADCSAP
jgi:hypothetical protein